MILAKKGENHFQMVKKVLIWKQKQNTKQTWYTNHNKRKEELASLNGKTQVLNHQLNTTTVISGIKTECLEKFEFAELDVYKQAGYRGQIGCGFLTKGGFVHTFKKGKRYNLLKHTDIQERYDNMWRSMGFQVQTILNLSKWILLRSVFFTKNLNNLKFDWNFSTFFFAYKGTRNRARFH